MYRIHNISGYSFKSERDGSILVWEPGNEPAECSYLLQRAVNMAGFCRIAASYLNEKGVVI